MKETRYLHRVFQSELPIDTGLFSRELPILIRSFEGILLLEKGLSKEIPYLSRYLVLSRLLVLTSAQSTSHLLSVRVTKH